MAELQEAEIRGRIKRARKEAGLSQVEMAELLEVIPRTVQNYENDHVPWGRLRDIAQITGVDVRWLLHGGEVSADVGDERLQTIEEKLDRLLAILEVSPPVEESPGVVAGAGAPLRELVESRTPKAPGRRASRPAKRRHSGA